jgi:hypothetical protein
MLMEIILAEIDVANAFRNEFIGRPVIEFAMIAAVATVVQIVEITDEQRESRMRAKMVDFESIFPIRPIFMPQAICATLLEIFAHITPETTIVFLRSRFGSWMSALKACHSNITLSTFTCLHRLQEAIIGGIIFCIHFRS